MMEQLFRRTLETEGTLPPAIQTAIYDYAAATKSESLLEGLLGRAELTDELDERIGSEPNARLVSAWLRRKKRSSEQIMARLEVEKRKKRITVFEVLASIEDLDDVVYEMAASIGSIKIAVALLDNDKAVVAHKAAVRTIATQYSKSTLSYRQKADINRVLANRTECSDVLATHATSEHLLTIAARAGTLTGASAKVAFTKMLALCEKRTEEIVRTMTAGTSRWRSAHGDEASLIENIKSMAMLAPSIIDHADVIDAEKRLHEMQVRVATVLDKGSSTPASVAAAISSMSAAVSQDSPLSKLRAATTHEAISEALKPFAADLKESANYRSGSGAVAELVAGAILTNRAASTAQVRKALSLLGGRRGFHVDYADLTQFAMNWLDDFDALSEFVAAGLINDDEALSTIAKNFTPQDLWRAGCEKILERETTGYTHWHASLFASRYADRSRAVAMAPQSFTQWTEPALAEATVGALSDVLGADLEAWKLLDRATSARPSTSFEDSLAAVALARKTFGSDERAMSLWLAVLGSDSETDVSTLVRRVAKLRATVTSDRAMESLTGIFRNAKHLVHNAKDAKAALDQAVSAYTNMGDDQGFWDALAMLAPRHKQDIKRLFLTCRRAVVDERSNDQG